MNYLNNLKNDMEMLLKNLKDLYNILHLGNNICNSLNNNK